MPVERLWTLLSRTFEHDWRHVTLWVFAENQPARDFYSQFGLMPDGAEMTHAGSGATEVRLSGSIAS